jgi:phospholipid/cholesterol/gamma-HCH transport system permease protein
LASVCFWDLGGWMAGVEDLLSAEFINGAQMDFIPFHIVYAS